MDTPFVPKNFEFRYVCEAVIRCACSSHALMISMFCRVAYGQHVAVARLGFE